MSHLFLLQVPGLATWRVGIIIDGLSTIPRVSTLIAKINLEKTNTVRQRLKEWYQDTNCQKRKKENS